MRIFVSVLILALVCLEADAAEIRLNDGSVVIGTILRLVDGEDLVVDTEYMDEVTIEWQSVAGISGTQVVDIITYDDRRFIGTVVFDRGDVTIYADGETMVAPQDIFSIEELSDSFWDAIDVYTDLGMNIVRGNNEVTQLSFGAGVGYEGKDFETSVDASTIINEQLETQDTRRTTFNASYTYLISTRWQGSGFYQFESDEQQDLEGRSLIGSYLGHRILNSRRHRFDVYAGVAINSEKFEGLPREETPEGLVGAAYRLRSIVDLDTRLTFFPNLEESGRLRSQFDATLSVDLFADLDFKLTAYNRYDSDPPEANDKNDSGLTVGLSWEY
jgi:putative salt-induced outer membrane protein YdiY